MSVKYMVYMLSIVAADQCEIRIPAIIVLLSNPWLAPKSLLIIHPSLLTAPQLLCIPYICKIDATRKHRQSYRHADSHRQRPWRFL